MKLPIKFGGHISEKTTTLELLDTLIYTSLLVPIHPIGNSSIGNDCFDFYQNVRRPILGKGNVFGIRNISSVDCIGKLTYIVGCYIKGKGAYTSGWQRKGMRVKKIITW